MRLHGWMWFGVCIPCMRQSLPCHLQAVEVPLEVLVDRVVEVPVDRIMQKVICHQNSHMPTCPTAQHNININTPHHNTHNTTTVIMTLQTTSPIMG